MANVTAGHFSWGRLLPSEHGSWALAFEPVVLGLVAAPSRAGSWLSVVVVAAFLARRPLRQLSILPEAKYALAGLGALGLVSLFLAIAASGLRPLLPLAAAMPAAFVFLWYDRRREAREGVAEIAGAATFALVPAALAVCAGRSLVAGLALAVFMLARSVPTVLVVRAYLRRRKGRPAGIVAALTVSAGAVLMVAGFQLAGSMPALGLVLTLGLFIRAVWLLGPWCPNYTARQVGIGECFAGVGFVVIGGLFW